MFSVGSCFESIFDVEGFGIQSAVFFATLLSMACRLQRRKVMRFMQRDRHLRLGFTVLEITVVLCTIVILISLLLPAIQQAREQARRHQCQQNLAQIGIALRSYHDAHRYLPPGVVNPTGPVVSRSHEANMFDGMLSSMGGYGGGSYGYGMGFGADYGDGDANDYDGGQDASGDLSGDANDSEERQAESASEKAAKDEDTKRFNELRSEYLVSWIAQILPQLDRQATYRRIDFQTPQLSFVRKRRKEQWYQQLQDWNTLNEASVPWFPEPEPSDLPFLHCPSRVSSGLGDALVETHYSGCYSSKAVPIDSDNDGMLYLNSSESMDAVPDGASSTILVGESSGGIFRSYYYGDHSSLRATERVALESSLDRYADYGQRNSGSIVDNVDMTKDPTSMGFSAMHNVVSMFLFADGSVRPISTMIDAEIFASLGSRKDGSLLSSDQF